MTDPAENSGASRLLIFDDEEAVSQTLGLIAVRMRFDVRIVGRSDQFLRQLETWAPTHIALDLAMPRMDGVQILRLLAERRCRAMIIITSGGGGRILEAARCSAEGFKLNIAGVLPKPFNPTTLRAFLGKQPPTPSASPASAGVAVAMSDITDAMFRRALERKELELAYQPKIDCGTGRVAGFEALARWRDPVAGLVMPDRFIPLAEQSDLIDVLTRQVCELALRWMTRSRVSGDLTMSVNISVRNLRDTGLPDWLFDLCQELGVDPARVILELSETSAMEDTAASLALLTRLRMKRFHLSIDDFGTGYSSMVQLVRLPLSEMKVDRSLVINAAQSEESRTVIKSIVDLGHGLGLSLTAEGVEDEETMKFLAGIGCDLAQGYHMGRPMPGDQALSFLGSRE